MKYEEVLVLEQMLAAILEVHHAVVSEYNRESQSFVHGHLKNCERLMILIRENLQTLKAKSEPQP